MAQDDPEFRALLDKENTTSIAPTHRNQGGGMKTDDYTDERMGDEVMVMGSCNGRWDKSLGVLCQKFVMLFLVTPVGLTNSHTQTHVRQYLLSFLSLYIFQEHEVTLDYAGNVLMPDTVEYAGGNILIQPVTNPKSK